MPTVKTGRISWVDYARGIAILLVVYRHVVVGMQRAGIEVSHFMYNLQEVFYNFRMPVFFIISGAFLALSLKKVTALKALKDRMSTILYPYLFWGVVLISLEIIFARFTNANRSLYDFLHIITQPRAVDHLWYLFALFNASALFLLLSGFLKNNWLHLAVAILLHWFTFTSYLQGNSLVSDAFYFYPYFLIGTFVYEWLLDKHRNKIVFNKKYLAVLIPLFLAGQVFWFFNQQKEDIYFGIFFLINIIGCAMVYYISYFLDKASALKYLSYIGTYSLYIYILHVPIAACMRNVFLRTGIDASPWIILATCWLAGVIFPIVFINVFKKYGVLKLFSLK